MTTTSMDAKLGRVSLEVDGSVARIVLRRPPLNIIDIPMMEELAQSLAEIESRPDVSMIVVSGQGTAFSAGVDVAAHTPDKVNEMLTKFHAVIRALVAAKTVTIAAVHGHCLGGGAHGLAPRALYRGMDCLPRWTNVSEDCERSVLLRWHWRRRPVMPGTRCTSIKVWLGPSGFIDRKS